jgi:hypothetical protein
MAGGTNFRIPLGVYTRPTPDYFEHQSAYASAQQDAAPSGDLAMCALYNNDSTSRFIRINAMSITTTPAGIFGWQMQNRNLGSFFAQALPLRPDLGQPPGATYAAVVTPFFAPPDGAPLFEGSATFNFIQTNGIFGILPMGWAFEITTNEPGIALSCTWWYTFLPDP